MKVISKRKIVPIIIIFSFTALLGLTILLLVKSHQIDEAEIIALHNYSDNFVNYIANLEKSEEDEEDGPTLYQQQLAIALDYFYYEKGQNQISNEEFSKFLKENFDANFDSENFSNDLYAKLFQEKYIEYDPEKHIISLNPAEPTKKERAIIPIPIMTEKSVKKKGSTYIVEYEKYLIESPYDALNCLADSNNSNEPNDEESDKIAKMVSYLNGESTIKSAQDAITPECANQLSEPRNTVVVTYEIENSKFKISSINH